MVSYLNNSVENLFWEPYYFSFFSNQEKSLSDYKNNALIFGPFKIASFFTLFVSIYIKWSILNLVVATTSLQKLALNK